MVRMGRGPINVDHYVADTGDNPGTATEAPRFPDLGRLPERAKRQ